MIGIIYGSSMGNTADAANLIAETLGLPCEVINVGETDAGTINGFDKLILGSSTWGSGDLQDDWDAFDFGSLNLSGKTVACFGMGDSASYSDEYCNALAKLYDAAKAAGGNMIDASVSTDGYEFDGSDAVRDGVFVGLALDADNQGDLTAERVNSWVAKIKPSFE